MDSKPRKVWTVIEDEILFDLVNSIGKKKWVIVSAKMAKKLGFMSKTPKQCRERWLNILDPTITGAKWTDEEDMMLFEKYRTYGASWCKIAKCFSGRSGNSIKNRFYSIVRKNLRKLNKNKPKPQRIVGNLKVLLRDRGLQDTLIRIPDSKPPKKKHLERKLEDKLKASGLNLVNFKNTLSYNDVFNDCSREKNVFSKLLFEFGENRIEGFERENIFTERLEKCYGVGFGSLNESADDEEVLSRDDCSEEDNIGRVGEMFWTRRSSIDEDFQVRNLNKSCLFIQFLKELGTTEAKSNILKPLSLPTLPII
ncbi:hypothetical protein SteCoe_12362 [Stentor coeruleus]|uniref:Myb-like DNA-binding domain containing protein n=1 Tax=Stentor coeruleus TaxID=5963 RepID=A0A1R2CAZ3_9CILI|nr:hypothetical protein SteCoe_12362 [Stentor coeruleus]